MNSLIIISIIITVILIFSIILIVVLSRKKNKNKEVPASILDVQNIGVSTNDQEFSYGYEKEETIVMQPVNSNLETLNNIDNKQTENIQNTKVLNVAVDDAAKDTNTLNIYGEKSEYTVSKNINNYSKETFDDSNNNIEIESIVKEDIIK